MIEGFEDFTSELNEKELELIPVMVKAFRKYGKDNPIKAKDIVAKFNESAASVNIELSGPRLRKMCNYIRTNGLLPLIATSNGYYVSYDKKEIEAQISSLMARSNSIKRCADGLQKILDRQ